ncbi:hypothetical protein KAX75_10270 [candidate division WOR-3 bacterium]|nr:hypothetical protein [candidate division WOR-3 bacterium]
MKKNTIAYSGIIFGFIVAAFLLAIIIPVHNAKADETSSDFYGDVYFGVHGQPPDEDWALYTKVTKGAQSSNWHYQTKNDWYNENAIYGTGTYRVDAEHRIFSTQEVKARGFIVVVFTGDPIRRYIVTLPDNEDEE